MEIMADVDPDGGLLVAVVMVRLTRYANNIISRCLEAVRSKGIMTKLTLDADLRSKLNGLDEPLEVCDEFGRTVGHFLPSALYDELFYAALAAESPHSKEELRRRHQETRGRSLAEIWKDLKAR